MGLTTVYSSNASIVATNTDGATKVTATATVMSNGLTIFNTTGDIIVMGLASECYTANDATASTLQYSVTNNTTTGTQTISAASASLASAGIGVSALVQLGALTNVPVVTNNAGVGTFPWGSIRVPGNSSIKLVIGVGSTTGTWKHYIRYYPFEDGAAVTAAF